MKQTAYEPPDPRSSVPWRPVVWCKRSEYDGSACTEDDYLCCCPVARVVVNDPSTHISNALEPSQDSHLSDPTVLIADDEQQLTDIYATWLEESYTTRTAYCGAEAMDLLDESIDIAILDRQMPGHSGEELISTIRDGGFDCRAAMISANEPGLEMLDVDYDLYQTKPVTDPDEFCDLLETLCRRANYDANTQRLLALAAKRNDIETYVSKAKLDESPKYFELCTELESLCADVPDAEDALEVEGLPTSF